ncbi:hypothetical protein ACA910_022234 [Epithemia clementina (nom. ined.)]
MVLRSLRNLLELWSCRHQCFHLSHKNEHQELFVKRKRAIASQNNPNIDKLKKTPSIMPFLERSKHHQFTGITIEIPLCESDSSFDTAALDDVSILSDGLESLADGRRNLLRRSNASQRSGDMPMHNHATVLARGQVEGSLFISNGRTDEPRVILDGDFSQPVRKISSLGGGSWRDVGGDRVNSFFLQSSQLNRTT